MSEESWCDLVSSSAWWSTSSDEHTIWDFHKQELFQIVKTSLIDNLSQKFVGRLSAIFFKSRHVDIIDEENHFFTTQGTDLGSSFFGKLILIQEHGQKIVSIGLSREVHRRVCVLIQLSGTEEITNDDWLTNTCLTWNKAVFLVFNQFVQKILVLDSVTCRYKDVEIWSVRVVLELSNQLWPVVELLLFEINEIVVDLVFIRERRIEFKDFVLDMVTEFYSGVIFDVVVKICACWPNERENQNHWATRISIEVRHFVEILSRCQLVEHDVENINAALNQIVVNCTNYLLAFLSQET